MMARVGALSPARWGRRVGTLALSLGNFSSPRQVLKPPQGHRVWQAQMLLQISKTLSTVFFKEKECFPPLPLPPADETSESRGSKTLMLLCHPKGHLHTLLVPPQKDKPGAPPAPTNSSVFPSMI